MPTFAHIREAVPQRGETTVLPSTPFTLRRPRVALLAFALLVAMAAVSRSAPASAGDPASGPSRLGPQGGGYYNPVAPRLERLRGQQERLGKLSTGAKAKLAPSPKVLAQADAFDRKNAEGFPPAAKQLGMLEARAAKTGKSPRAFKKAPAPRRPGCSRSWPSS